MTTSPNGGATASTYNFTAPLLVAVACLAVHGGYVPMGGIILLGAVFAAYELFSGSRNDGVFYGLAAAGMVMMVCYTVIAYQGRGYEWATDPIEAFRIVRPLVLAFLFVALMALRRYMGL